FSLTVVGIMAAIVQGGLTRIVVQRIGERKAAVLGLVIGTIAFTVYGLATKGWMIYAMIIAGSIGGVMGPSIQGLISRSVGANEQGGVQGSLTSLASIAGIIGPPVATGLFGYFISSKAPIYLPGSAFLFSSAVVFVAMLLALRSFRKLPDATRATPQPVTVSTK